MDSPLNRAHQWGRKADAFKSSGNYDEAIMCHNRAAENMLETLQTPLLYDNPSLMSCLRQQHEHHLRTVKALQSEQLRQSIMEVRKSRPVTLRNRAMQTDNLNMIPHRSAGNHHDNVLVNTQDIEESIREADTILRFLKNRKDDPEVVLPWENPADEHANGSAEKGSGTAIAGVKKPKDDTVIIEELRYLTGELQVHIKQLFQESERLKSENQSLSKKLANQEQLQDSQDSQEQSVNYLTPLTSHFSNSTSFNLPPLEMPLLQQPPKLSSDSEDDLSDRI